MAETKGSKQMMNELFKKFELNVEDHFFENQHYKIITRAGIDKIQATAEIKIHYEPVPEFSSPEMERFVVKAIGTYGDETIETFGEADLTNYPKKVYSKGPNQGKDLPWYPIAMAEKRAMSRCVLKLAGFYALGVFGEDEAEDFKDAVRRAKKEKANTPQIKN